MVITEKRKMSKDAEINFLALGFSIILFMFVLYTGIAHAEEGDSLTTLFQTRVFRGSWEFLTQFGWIAGIMNWIISIFSFIGMGLIMLSRMTSILYLTNRSLFDQVYEIKNNGRGQGFFGLKSAFQDTFNAKYDTGADAFVSFFLALLPNIKRYSDYNPERPNSAIDENDNALNYMLKLFPSTVLTMLLLAMGYGGQLGKAYGMVTDGMMVVADEFVAFRLDEFIQDTINIGENYKFTLNNSGTEEGKVKQSIANGVYRAIISKFPLDSTAKQSVGRQVEQFVQSSINAGSLQPYVSDSIDLNSDAGWKAIKTEVTMNSNPTAEGAVATFDLSSVGYSGSSPLYVHIFARQSGNAGQNWFEKVD